MSAIATPAPLAPTTPPPVGGPRAWRCTREQYERFIAAGFFRESRYQLVRGEIIDMGKEGPRHFSVVDLAVEVLKAAFGPGFFVRNAGPLSFADSQPEPDVAVVRGSRLDYLATHPDTALLAVEIAETSLAYDTTTKAELYATAGIADYWVLDVVNRQLHVFRDPRRAPALDVTAYQTHHTYGPNDTVSPLAVPNATVRVGDLLP